MKVLKSADGEEIPVNEYPGDRFIKRRSHQIGKYLSSVAGFDIETSNVEVGGEPLAIMYLWQYVFDYGVGRDVYVGRYWSDLQLLLSDIESAYDLCDSRRLVTLDHNAAFEFQFLRSVGEISDMFAVKERVPVRFMFRGCHEFRCTYKLTNMSLAKFCEAEGAQHAKISNFDYLLTRYPDTPITEYGPSRFSMSDLQYGVYDVLGMVESFRSLLNAEHDDLKTCPYTSTGYVRRESRERIQSNPANRRTFLASQLNAEEYKLCKAATRGGNVHANCLFVGEILKNISGHDKASSYPWQMVSKLVPTGQFLKETSGRIARDCANIMLVKFTNLRIKPGVYNPYLPYNKCERYASSSPKQMTIDNGRILIAPQIVIGITEIDFDIIDRQYTFDFEIIEHYVCGLRELPKEFRDYILEMFKAKCELKHSDPYFYAKFKNKINALFGMLLTDITREDVTYTGGKWGHELPSVAEALRKYYKNYRSFLSYQQGIYITAWARAELQRGIDAVGDDFVYSDTDSVKYRGEHAADFEAINADLIKEADACGVSPVVIGDEVFRLGVWEYDCNYSEFCTHGAKKYAYVYSMDPVNGKHRGELGVTVAGLSKSSGAKYLEEHGGLTAFKVGQLWDCEVSGRLQAVYDDRIRLDRLTIDGHACEVTSNVALIPTTYTLKYTKEYAELLEMRDVYFD